MHGRLQYYAGRNGVAAIQGNVSRPKARYSMVLKNYVTGARLKVELVDLPFMDGRRFRVRVNGQWARKVPVASRTLVVRQVRAWLVKH